MGKPSVGRKAVVVSLLVAAPLVLLIVLTQTAAWPDPLPAGDNALNELSVWHPLHDVQLTGSWPNSRCSASPGLRAWPGPLDTRGSPS